MSQLRELRQEALEAAEEAWFVQSLQEIERTDVTLSLRLTIRRGLFVELFCGEKSGSLYMALIEGGRRLFGVDRERGEWHIHPYEAVEKHEPLQEGFEPKPVTKFLARVEVLLVEHDLL